MKTTDTHAHRMHRARAEQLHQFVAQGLQTQAAPHFLRGDLRQLDGVAAAEEIRRREQVDVQAVALDPFAAVEHTAHRTCPRPDVDVEQCFQRLRGGDLIGHRADAADARDEIRHLRVMAAF